MDQKHGDRHAQKKICTRIEAQNANLSLRRRGFGRLFGDGFIVNLLNPKTALFFLAFLPQFVEASRGHLAMQIAFLGVLFTFLGLITDGCYARFGRQGGVGCGKAGGILGLSATSAVPC